MARLRRRHPYDLYRFGSWVAARAPHGSVRPLARIGGEAAALLSPRKRSVVARNQQRALGPGPAANRREVRRAVRQSFVSYTRYWLEALRLPVMTPEEVDSRFTIEGLEHIRQALAAGHGAVLAIPHVGGWEVGGAWLVRQGIPLTVVAEAVQPPELLEWFVRLREGIGLTVIPLDLRAGARVLRALRHNQTVALLCDRDIGGRGVEVEFFGERTTLPEGPALLAARAASVVLPTAIYFHGDGHHAVVRAPVLLEGDATADTQRLAAELEILIRQAPDQWHLFQPNWPSDRV